MLLRPLSHARALRPPSRSVAVRVGCCVTPIVAQGVGWAGVALEVSLPGAEASARAELALAVRADGRFPRNAFTANASRRELSWKCCTACRALSSGAALVVAALRILGGKAARGKLERPSASVEKRLRNAASLPAAPRSQLSPSGRAPPKAAPGEG